MTNELVMDIETIANPRLIYSINAMAYDSGLDPLAYGALSPALCSIVCVAMHNQATGRSAIFSWPRNGEPLPNDLGASVIALPSEDELLFTVANTLKSFGDFKLVTYGGRSFDVPVLVHRMVANRVFVPGRLAKIAQAGRYKTGNHIDLFEEFTFAGAVRSKGLSMRAFSLGYHLGDPKAGMDGSNVWDRWQEGKSGDIATYCLGDVMSTVALLKRWRDSGMGDRT